MRGPLPGLGLLFVLAMGMLLAAAPWMWLFGARTVLGHLLGLLLAGVELTIVGACLGRKYR